MINLMVVRRMVNPSEGLKHEIFKKYWDGLLVRRMVNPSEGLKRAQGWRKNQLPGGPKDGQPE